LKAYAIAGEIAQYLTGSQHLGDAETRQSPQPVTLIEITDRPYRCRDLRSCRKWPSAWN